MAELCVGVGRGLHPFQWESPRAFPRKIFIWNFLRLKVHFEQPEKDFSHDDDTFIHPLLYHNWTKVLGTIFYFNGIWLIYCRNKAIIFFEKLPPLYQLDSNFSWSPVLLENPGP